MLDKANASSVSVNCGTAWHLTTSLSTFETSLPMSTFRLQHNNNTGWMSESLPLAKTAANLKAGDESQGSHCAYLHTPDTLPAWAQTQHLIPLPVQSITEAHCVLQTAAVYSKPQPLYLSPFTQRQGVMAVANFQYITRMSSGFKVYILEGKLSSIFIYSLILLHIGEYLYYFVSYSGDSYSYVLYLILSHILGCLFLWQW